MPWKLDPVGGAWITLVVAAALLLVPWLLAPQEKALTPQRRWTLLGLRVAATLLLILAWLRPTLLSIRTEPLPATLLLLVDASRSMSVEDAIDGESRWASARRLIVASSASIERLSVHQEVRAYAFDAELRPITVTDQGGVELPDEPAGGQTALGAALEELLTREGDRRLMGVVLLSDGAQRALPPRDLSPLVAARRLSAEGAPLFALPLGERSSGDRADLAIEDLLVSESVFAQTPLEASAVLRVEGYANREARVRLLWENEEGKQEVVDSATVRAAPGVEAFPILLRHTPRQAGEWKLSVRVEPLDGETLTGNNTASTFVTVREGGLRVLYLVGAERVGGPPGLEQRFVRSSLRASPDIAVERKVFDYRQRRQSLDAELDGVDVIVLDNLDADALDRPTWERVATLVERGVGLAMIGGAHSFGPGGHRGTPLAGVLPIELGRAERQAFGQPIRADVHLEGPLTITPTDPLGLRHPVMQLSGAEWAELPPLDGANRIDRTRLKPSAVVLADSGSDTRHPLVVAAQPGVGRVLALAGDSTWRWVLQGHGEAHRRFWRQAILWLAKQEEAGENQVYVELGSRRVAPGAKLDITAGVRLSDPSQADGLAYTALVTLPDGQTRELAIAGGADRSRATFRDTFMAGDYEVEVRAVGADGQPLGDARARLLVPEQDLELDRPEAEPDLLARLAQSTAAAGGAVLAPEELPQLLERLADEPIEEKQEIVSRYTPWSTWPFFLLLVGLMSVEWWLRRKWGMP